MVAGLGAYGWSCRSVIHFYRARLVRQRSDAHRLMLSWLSRAVAALFVLLAIWAAYGIYDLVRPLGYSGLMGSKLGRTPILRLSGDGLVGQGQ